jgi:hypothetical protein
MKKCSILLILGICILLCTSCQQIMNRALSEDKEDSFTIPLEAYYGTDLRIDGYYYRKHNTDKIYSIYVFYNNGVCKLSTESAKSIEGLDSLIQKDDWKKYPHIKWTMGVFRIPGPKIISFQILYPQSNEPLNLTGVILNDTTYLIRSTEPSTNNSYLSQTDEEYHFRKLSPKPDSLDHTGPEDILLH